jgi:hypothetical protein
MGGHRVVGLDSLATRLFNTNAIVDERLDNTAMNGIVIGMSNRRQGGKDKKMAAVATTDIRAALDAKIRENVAEVGRIERDARDTIKGIERENKQLEKARDALVSDAKRRNGGSRTATKVDPAKRAGPKAIGLVSDYLKSKGEAFQSAMVKDLPLQPSVVSYAVRALREAGQIEQTGNAFRASHEYRWVGAEPQVGEVETPVGTSEQAEKGKEAAAANN